MNRLMVGFRELNNNFLQPDNISLQGRRVGYRETPHNQLARKTTSIGVFLCSACYFHARSAILDLTAHRCAVSWSLFPLLLNDFLYSNNIFLFRGAGLGTGKFPMTSSDLSIALSVSAI